MLGAIRTGGERLSLAQRAPSLPRKRVWEGSRTEAIAGHDVACSQLYPLGHTASLIISLCDRGQVSYPS